jgi:hypothetical protein
MVFDSIDKYLAASGKKIFISWEIPGSDSYLRKIKKGRGELLNYIFNDGSNAYECPFCEGIVVGKPVKTKYENINSKGETYSCRICGTQLGNKCEKRV